MAFVKYHWKKFALIIFLFAAFLGRFQAMMPKRQFADFHVNYYTGQRMLNHQNVYDLDGYRKDGMANFKYPPIFATITALFALTSERIAATSWFAVGFVLLIIFVHFSGRLIFPAALTHKQRNWVYFWSLFFTSRFCMQNFDEGQVNFLMMTTLLLGLYACSKKKEWLAGLLFGFSILVKYMSAIFLPYFLLKRKFKLVFYTLCSIIIFSFFPAFIWGWKHNFYLQQQFFPYLCKTSLDIYSLSDSANQSIYSALVRLFSNYGGFGINVLALNDVHLFSIVMIVPAVLYGLIFLPSKHGFQREGDMDPVDVSLIFLCAALFNPNAWIHAFLFMLFGYMTVITYLIKCTLKDRIAVALTALSFFLHSFSSSFFTEWWAGDHFETLSFVTFGALVFFVCLLKIKFFPHRECSLNGTPQTKIRVT